jgi:AraC-like DNA-binding protein
LQSIFDSKTLPAAKRRQAWHDAICEIYLQVDCTAQQQDDYEGFVRELRFGAVTLTDTLSSPQSVLRQKRHLARLEKDCYFMGLAQSGCVTVHQASSSLTMHPGVGALYCASEPYQLRCDVKLRSFWAELPRQAFASRFDSEAPPLMARLDLSRGLGRIAVEFCATLAQEGAQLDLQPRAELGEQFMDLLALAISADSGRQAAADVSVRRARLRSVKSYIDAHLSDPHLSLAKIAEKNGISLRYLHLLFRPTDMSVSEWVRMRRLQRCYEQLTSPMHRTRSVTEIAYAMGFSSSSHFSNLFRSHFGLRPTDVRGRVSAPEPSQKKSLLSDSDA